MNDSEYKTAMEGLQVIQRALICNHTSDYATASIVTSIMEVLERDHKNPNSQTIQCSTVNVIGHISSDDISHIAESVAAKLFDKLNKNHQCQCKHNTL